MFRRLANGVKSLLNSASPAGATAIAAGAKQSFNPSVPPSAAAAAAATSQLQQKAEAHMALKDAIKELSADMPQMGPSPSSQEKLRVWSQKSPDELDKEQLEELAKYYLDGLKDVIPKDPSKAISLWTEAIKHGSLESKYSRAICFREGVGTLKDPEKAFQEMKQLADDENFNLAHFIVASMLSTGEGCAKDEAAAFQHFKLAARGGVQPALYNIGNCYAGGKGVKQNDKNATLYYEAGAEAGDPSALFTLGMWYINGRAGSVDSEKSFNLQLRAAGKGHPGATFNVGVCYLSGAGIPTGSNNELAVEWFQKAVRMKIPEAAVNLANMHVEGKGVKKDLQSAIDVLTQFSYTHDGCRALKVELEGKLKNRSED